MQQIILSKSQTHSYIVYTHTLKAILHKYVRCAIKVVLGTTKSTTDYLFNALLFGSSLFSSFVQSRRSHFLLMAEWDSIWSSNRKFVLFSRIKWCNKTDCDTNYLKELLVCVTKLVWHYLNVSNKTQKYQKELNC